MFYLFVVDRRRIFHYTPTLKITRRKKNNIQILSMILSVITVINSIEIYTSSYYDTNQIKCVTINISIVTKMRRIHNLEHIIPPLKFFVTEYIFHIC